MARKVKPNATPVTQGPTPAPTPTPLRDRVKELVRVRAGDLAGAPWNWRDHPKRQEAAVVASLEELGIYAPVLGRRLDDGTVELIDGHLRRLIFQRMAPDTPVPVVITDLSEDEARKANLLHDPLAALAEANAGKLDELLRSVQTSSQELAEVFDQLAAQAGLVPGVEGDEAGGSGPGQEMPPEQYLVQIECSDEEHQRELLERLMEEGLTVKAILI